ncbi:MAG: AraC family transcriptional regulator [Sutterella sp.]|nr:AraC family transcriptional regulator [Sutterella sp.]
MPDSDWQFHADRLMSRIAERYRENRRDWTKIRGLNLSWSDHDETEMSCFYTLSAALILQGDKRVRVGSVEHVYGAGGMVSLSLKLDPYFLAELAREGGLASGSGCVSEDAQALCVCESTAAIVEAFDQLVRLLDDENELKVLEEGCRRRIHWLVLTHSRSLNLRQLCDRRLPGSRIAEAVAWIREHYREPLPVEKLASVSAMSVSTFHHHFKAITSLSPLQYQKRMRLHEAKRLMLSENRSASTAAFEVDYVSVQQFTRDYKRLFGNPPGRDAKESKGG